MAKPDRQKVQRSVKLGDRHLEIRNSILPLLCTFKFSLVKAFKNNHIISRCIFPEFKVSRQTINSRCGQRVLH